MTRPRITIGMVVRNGERSIAQAIESFLAQSCRDFTLVVHDNASTDRTRDVVAAIAKRDDRVRLIARSHDVGVVGNLIEAAASATTPLFCWAACDDLRAPTFLERMAALLDAHSDASLASCAVRNIDPDGSQRDVRPETASLQTTTGMNASRRLRMYLRDMPGTPFYGVFRTPALQRSLDIVREIDACCGDDGQPMLGLDMVFLARFIRDFGIAYSSEPLLLFRRGGISHNVGRFGGLRNFLRQLVRFSTMLRRATVLEAPWSQRTATNCAQRTGLCRWLFGREMRAMFRHYLVRSMPAMQRLHARLAVMFDPALRRLRRRLSTLPADARIVLFGAGKHTRRRLADVRRASAGRAVIVAACDDHAAEVQPIPGLSIVRADDLPSISPDVLLVSSDAYEAAMYCRARAVAPATTMIWCLYDLAIEHNSAAGTLESTSATNADISSNAVPAAAGQ